jgi:hypothetical protein
MWRLRATQNGVRCGVFPCRAQRAQPQFLAAREHGFGEDRRRAARRASTCELGQPQRNGGESGIRTVCLETEHVDQCAAGTNRAAPKVRGRRPRNPRAAHLAHSAPRRPRRPSAEQWRREWDSHRRYPSGHTCWPASTRPSSAATPSAAGRPPPWLCSRTPRAACAARSWKR